MENTNQSPKFSAWVCFGRYSSEGFDAATFPELRHTIAQVYSYHSRNHDNVTVIASKLCPNCIQGKVRRCRASKRHANGYHGERCYKQCPVCKGQYETRIDPILGHPLTQPEKE